MNRKTVWNHKKHIEHNILTIPAFCILTLFSSYRFDAPALVSFPHFYLADPFYLEPIEGLSPNKDKHESFLNLEPSTGLPLNVDVNIQLNLLMQPIEGIT